MSICIRRAGLVMALIAALVVAGTLVGRPGVSAASAWKTLPNMPTARSGAGAVTVNGVVYVIGGFTGTGEITAAGVTNVVEAYHPDTNTWDCSTGDTGTGCSATTLAPMPTPRWQAAAAAVNGLIYVIGGYTGSSAAAFVEIYDPATNSWTCSGDDLVLGCSSVETTIGPMPVATWHSGVASLNGSIYVLGGDTNGVAQTDAVQVLDTSTGAWTTPTTLPTARSGLSAGSANGLIYTFGGEDFHPGSPGYTNYEDLVEAYNPTTQTWICSTDDTSSGCSSMTLAPMPQVGNYGGGPRSRMGVAQSGGNFYFLGGYGPSSSGGTTIGFWPTTISYSPATNSWNTNLPDISNNLNDIAGASTPNGGVYAIGGDNYYNSPPVQTAEVLYTSGISVTAPAAVQPGTSFSITVTIYGSNGDVDTGYTGTVHFTSSDSSATLPANYTFTPTDAGSHTFSVALETAGSQTITATDTSDLNFSGQATVLIDGTAPTANASAVLTGTSTAYTFGSWTNQNVTVTLTAGDNTGGSGVESIQYSINSGPPVVVDGSTTTFTVSGGGTNTISYSATDNAGNSSSSQSVDVDIDTATPTVTPSAVLAGTSTPYTFGTWTRQNVTVTLNASETGASGIKSITYTLTPPSGAEPPVTVDGNTTTFTIADQGQTAITYTAADNAGSSSALETVYVKIDNTPPTITIDAPTATRYTLDQNVSASYSCADPFSGVASCQGSVLLPDGASQSVADGEALPAGQLGSYRFTVAAIDNAGNQGSQSVSYTVGYDIASLPGSSQTVRQGYWALIRFAPEDALGHDYASRTLKAATLSLTGPSGPQLETISFAHAFQYGAISGQPGYQLAINTRDLAPGDWTLNITIGGNSALVYQIQFQVIS